MEKNSINKKEMPLKQILSSMIFFLCSYQLIQAQTIDTLKNEKDNCRKQASYVNAILHIPEGYQQLLSEPKWGFYPFGSFETAAFEKDGIAISIFNSDYFCAPSVSMRKLDYNPGKWIKTTYNHFDSLVRVQADTAYNFANISKSQLQKINADRGYIFNENSTRLYRNKYTMHKLIFLEKFDLGGILIVYSYNSQNEKLADKVIKETWGIVTFKNDKDFHPDSAALFGQKIIYLGKFAYANNPEDVKQDSIKFEEYKKKIHANEIIKNGLKLYAQKKYQEATDSFKSALSYDSLSSLAYSYIAYSFEAIKQMDSAWMYLTKGEKAFPRFEGFQLVKGDIYFMENKKDSAFEVYNEMGRNTKKWITCLYVGKKDLSERRFQDALQQFQRADSLFSSSSRSENGEIKFFIGIALNALDPSGSNMDEVKKYMEKAKQLGYKIPENIKQNLGL